MCVCVYSKRRRDETDRERERDRGKEHEGRQMSKLWAEKVPHGRSASSVSVNTMTMSLLAKREDKTSHKEKCHGEE